MNRDERDNADTPKGGTNEQRRDTGDRGRERTPPAMDPASRSGLAAERPGTAFAPTPRWRPME